MAEEKILITLQLDDSSLDKTLINNQNISSENSGETSGFHSSFCPVLCVVTESNNQKLTLTNELSYLNIDEYSLLSSKVITTGNKTLKEKLKTPLARDPIISNSDSETTKATQKY